MDVVLWPVASSACIPGGCTSLVSTASRQDPTVDSTSNFSPIFISDTNLPHINHILVSSMILKSWCLYSFYLRFEQTLFAFFLAYRTNELHHFILFLFWLMRGKTFILFLFLADFILFLRQVFLLFLVNQPSRPKGRNLSMLQWACALDTVDLAHHL